MEQVLSQSKSSRFAAVLLDAWEGGDIANVKHHLDSTAFIEPLGGLSELECERRELVNGIAETMRDALARHSGVMAQCDLEISLDLLRHLARTASN